MLLISENYQIVTPESAENGDYEEIGSNFLNEPFTFKELVDYIEREGFAYPSSSHVTKDCRNIWIETREDHNFITGESLYKTLHLTSSDPRAVKYWHKALLATGIIQN